MNSILNTFCKKYLYICNCNTIVKYNTMIFPFYITNFAQTYVFWYERE